MAAKRRWRWNNSNEMGGRRTVGWSEKRKRKSKAEEEASYISGGWERICKLKWRGRNACEPIKPAAPHGTPLGGRCPQPQTPCLHAPLVTFRLFSNWTLHYTLKAPLPRLHSFLYYSPVKISVSLETVTEEERRERRGYLNSELGFMSLRHKSTRRWCQHGRVMKYRNNGSRRRKIIWSETAQKEAGKEM